MAETKPKMGDSLRVPKPKKKLGLTVPPALRLPHEDLIIPLANISPKAPDASSGAASMPSQTSLTSLTRHTSQHDDINPVNVIQDDPPSMPSQTSLTSLTRHTQDVSQPVSPTRDFTKVANSIARQAVPAGLFTGKSKQLYDCLYALTRGAVVPTRTVRMSRPKLMKKSGIGSRVTFDANIERLKDVGLLIVRQITGEHEGNEYAVFLPEEIFQSLTSLTSQTSQTNPAQKLDRLVRLETSQTRHTLNPEESTVSPDPKTSFKTIQNFDDDEAFAGFTEVMKQSAREVTGKEPAKFERDRWRELAELLSVELKIAAARTSVSSVPSFLTEHLRRRLWKTDKKLKDMSAGKPSTTETSAPLRDLSDNCPDCGGTGFYYPAGYESGVAKCMHVKAVSENADEKRLTPFEITEQSGIIKDLLENGYTVAQAKEQFATSFHEEDWEKILGRATEK